MLCPGGRNGPGGGRTPGRERPLRVIPAHCPPLAQQSDCCVSLCHALKSEAGQQLEVHPRTSREALHMNKTAVEGARRGRAGSTGPVHREVCPGRQYFLTSWRARCPLNACTARHHSTRQQGRRHLPHACLPVWPGPRTGLNRTPFPNRGFQRQRELRCEGHLGVPGEVPGGPGFGASERENPKSESRWPVHAASGVGVCRGRARAC